MEKNIDIGKIQGINEKHLLLNKDGIEIITRIMKRTIGFDRIVRISIEYPSSNLQYVSIITNGLYVWGEHETTFYYSKKDEGKIRQLVEYIKCQIHKEVDAQVGIAENRNSIELKGLDGTYLLADAVSVTIQSKIRKIVIPIDEIKDVMLVDDGSSLPHIAVMRNPIFFKGDSEYDFYYAGDIEEARDAVTFIKIRKGYRD